MNSTRDANGSAGPLPLVPFVKNFRIFSARVMIAVPAPGAEPLTTPGSSNMSQPMTLPELFEPSARRFPANVFMWEKRNGRYQPTTYADTRERIHLCAAGFLALGLRPGDRVALISEGRNDWVVAELGILYAGGINVPLSVKLDEPADLRFRRISVIMN
jgi:acyl-CoA synthetase (AMP-forming)/AMP-acid ligase II